MILLGCGGRFWEVVVCYQISAYSNNLFASNIYHRDFYALCHVFNPLIHDIRYN